MIDSNGLTDLLSSARNVYCNEDKTKKLAIKDAKEEKVDK